MKARATCAIDLDALARNFAELRRVVGAKVQICAIVKADAYGHGAVPVSQTLAAKGVDQLGVACLEEALELRRAGIERPILVLGGVAPEDAERALDLDLSVVVWSAAAARRIAENLPGGRRLRIHLEVDTGMHRVGAALEELDSLTELLARGPFDFEGLMSHLACADEPDHPSIHLQYERFAEAGRRIAGAGGRPRLRHLAHSAGLLLGPELHFDMVRPGLLLYGCLPHPRYTATIDVSPVMTVRTRVVQILQVAAGEGVGYGHCFVTERPTRLAALPIGYGQGYPRALSATGYVQIRGRRAPIAGRVSMDHVTVDVTDLPEVAEGDEALLWGQSGAPNGGSIDVMELAERAGTIGYELLTRVGGRIRREAENASACAGGSQ